MTKRPWLVHLIAIAIIGLIAFGPLLISLGAGAFAGAFGCTLHEGFVNPCVVGGHDYGDTLYSLGLMGWASLITLPVGLLLGAVYVVVVLVLWLRRKYKTN